MAGRSTFRSACRRLAVALGWLAAALAAIGLCYALAGTLLAMIPRNAGWRPPPGGGITIWVEDNGVHTALVLPKVAAGVDWRTDFAAADLPDPRYARLDHLAIGWGERNFYLETPTWWDVRPAVVIGAALGSDDTLLHVEHVPRPLAGRNVRPIVLRADEYLRLAAAIRASRGAGQPLPGYFAYDAFYPGVGRYNAITTCNAWTGNILARAGVRVGWWTPFSATVMSWFPRPSP